METIKIRDNLQEKKTSVHSQRMRRASVALKRCTSSALLNKSIDNFTLSRENPRVRDCKRNMLSRTQDGRSTKSIKIQSAHKKFLSDYSNLIKLYPDFPSIMLKTLIVRERGNLRAVSRFLKSRGWKQSDVTVSRFENDEHSHVKTLHFWGLDNPAYYNVLEKKEIGSFFTVYSSGSYYIYFKTLTVVKKHAIPALDFANLPIAQLLSVSRPIYRPSSIQIADLIFLPQ